MNRERDAPAVGQHDLACALRGEGEFLEDRAGKGQVTGEARVQDRFDLYPSLVRARHG